jgi:hypothetical protein
MAAFTLDSLLAELKPKKGKVINLTTKRAVGANALDLPGEEGELEAWMARMAEETQWRTLARTMRFKKQTCLCCGNSTVSSEGLFLRQERGRITRFASRLYFTPIEANHFPLETMEFTETIPACFSCATTELLCEQVLNGKRQLPLSFG